MQSEDSRIRALRGRRPVIDPGRVIDALLEEERDADGRLWPALTLFLAGAECPFTCVYCDLWRHTLEAATPGGSLPAQIEGALTEHRRATAVADADTRLKLYNASNFFEARAVPPEDEEAIARLAEPFGRTVVECHPKLVADRCLAFGRRLRGRLEVAMGLETVHPEALPRLNKRMTVGDFDRAADRLLEAGLALRAFVLVGTPFVPLEETVEWAVRSVEHALAAGAGTVAIIPVRGGNGEMERLEAAGDFTAPRLADLEAALRLSLPLETRHGGVVTADLWDLERFSNCPHCFAGRRSRLENANRTGRWIELDGCPDCSSSAEQ